MRADDSGLKVIDVSNPAKPVLLGAVETPDAVGDIAVSGTVAYVCGLSGLHVIDVSDPASPGLLDSGDTPGEAWDIAVSDSVAYVADAASGLQIIDVSACSARPRTTRVALLPAEVVAHEHARRDSNPQQRHVGV